MGLWFIYTGQLHRSSAARWPPPCEENFPPPLFQNEGGKVEGKAEERGNVHLFISRYKDTNPIPISYNDHGVIFFLSATFVACVHFGSFFHLSLTLLNPIPREKFLWGVGGQVGRIFLRMAWFLCSYQWGVGGEFFISWWLDGWGSCVLRCRIVENLAARGEGIFLPPRNDWFFCSCWPACNVPPPPPKSCYLSF